MFLKNDIRFKSTGADAVGTSEFALPIEVVIDRPTAEAAFTEARRIADLLRSDSSATEVPAGPVGLVDPAARSKVSIEQRSRGEVRLELTVWLTLTPATGGDFWARTLAVARAADMAQRFALKPHGKGVAVTAGRVETVPQPPETPGDVLVT